MYRNTQLYDIIEKINNLGIPNINKYFLSGDFNEYIFNQKIFFSNNQQILF